MTDAFCCSRATQVLMKTLETVNVTEICPMHDNEYSSFLVSTLDVQMLKTTIKLTIAVNKKLTNVDERATKLAGIGSAWGTGTEALNR